MLTKTLAAYLRLRNGSGHLLFKSHVLNHFTFKFPDHFPITLHRTDGKSHNIRPDLKPGKRRSYNTLTKEWEEFDV